MISRFRTRRRYDEDALFADLVLILFGAAGLLWLLGVGGCHQPPPYCRTAHQPLELPGNLGTASFCDETGEVVPEEVAQAIWLTVVEYAVTCPGCASPEGLFDGVAIEVGKRHQVAGCEWTDGDYICVTRNHATHRYNNDIWVQRGPRCMVLADVSHEAIHCLERWTYGHYSVPHHSRPGWFGAESLETRARIAINEVTGC